MAAPVAAAAAIGEDGRFLLRRLLPNWWPPRVPSTKLLASVPEPVFHQSSTNPPLVIVIVPVPAAEELSIRT